MARAKATEGDNVESELEDLEVTPVIERADGFFGVEGMSDTTYYATKEEAARVAKNIAIQKAQRLNG